MLAEDVLTPEEPLRGMEFPPELRTIAEELVEAPCPAVSVTGTCTANVACETLTDVPGTTRDGADTAVVAVLLPMAPETATAVEAVSCKTPLDTEATGSKGIVLEPELSSTDAVLVDAVPASVIVEAAVRDILETLLEEAAPVDTLVAALIPAELDDDELAATNGIDVAAVSDILAVDTPSPMASATTGAEPIVKELAELEPEGASGTVVAAVIDALARELETPPLIGIPVADVMEAEAKELDTLDPVGTVVAAVTDPDAVLVAEEPPKLTEVGADIPADPREVLMDAPVLITVAADREIAVAEIPADVAVGSAVLAVRAAELVEVPEEI